MRLRATGPRPPVEAAPASFLLANLLYHNPTANASAERQRTKKAPCSQKQEAVDWLLARNQPLTACRQLLTAGRGFFPHFAFKGFGCYLELFVRRTQHVLQLIIMLQSIIQCCGHIQSAG